MTAMILRWMALLDKNDGQLLRHDDESQRTSIDDMDSWDEAIMTSFLERCGRWFSSERFKSRV